MIKEKRKQPEKGPQNTFLGATWHVKCLFNIWSKRWNYSMEFLRTVSMKVSYFPLTLVIVSSTKTVRGYSGLHDNTATNRIILQIEIIFWKFMGIFNAKLSQHLIYYAIWSWFCNSTLQLYVQKILKFYFIFDLFLDALKRTLWSSEVHWYQIIVL